MNTVSKVLGCVFGYLCLGLSVMVSAETIMRKVFATSLQGADELGGYVLAIGSSLAFCVALIGRNHMRIDLLHYLLPLPIQGLLNWLSMVLIAVFALLLSWTTLGIVRDTLQYHSTAPTPWATPMIYPQGIWYVCLTIFAVVAVIYAVRASRLFFTGRIEELNEGFQPKAAREELQEELEDVARRR
ncbi:MAG: TRAP transporter small permease [Rhodospirillales bacterium]|nr:TRAP transporter small permease [Rhodospirillales bacterium]